MLSLQKVSLKMNRHPSKLKLKMARVELVMIIKFAEDGPVVTVARCMDFVEDHLPIVVRVVNPVIVIKFL